MQHLNNLLIRMLQPKQNLDKCGIVEGCNQAQVIIVVLTKQAVSALRSYHHKPLLPLVPLLDNLNIYLR